MLEGKLITHVFHDENDHGWQFLSAEGASGERAMLVALEEVVKVDPTVLEVADLAPGWMATRTKANRTWTKKETYGDAPEIVIDWTLIESIEQFFDSILLQSSAPNWHGRNLNALRDSWITGGINPHGPPYRFRFIVGPALPTGLASFREAVEEAATESIDENGGTNKKAEQVVPPKSDRAGG